MEQLLESIVNGDYEVTTEGLLKSSAPKEDYDKFINLCEKIADVVSMPKDEKWQTKNEEVISNMKRKYPGSILLRTRRGKATNLKQAFLSQSESKLCRYSIDQIISKIESLSGMKSDKHWIVTTNYGVEEGRTINLFGPIGDSSFITIRVSTSNYKTSTELSYIKISITKRTKLQMRRYEKG